MFNLLTSNGSAIVDIVALCFVLGFALYGMIKGFTKTFIAMFGVIFSIFFAIILCTFVASFLESKYSFITTLSNSLSGTVGRIFGKEAMEMPLILASEQNILGTGGSILLAKIALSIKADNEYPIDTTLGQVVCPTLAYYITLIIAFICLFVIFMMIFYIIGKIVRKRYKIKLVEKVDRSLGFLLGLVGGIIYFETLVMLIGAIPLGATQNLYLLINNSTIAHAICVINPYDSILNLISFNRISNFVYSII